MSEFPSLEWMKAFQKIVNADEELSAIGQWFTASFLFQAGDARYVFKVEGGKLAQIVAEPRFDDTWSFALRAPLEHWRNFIKPLPPPLFNELFAMLMRVPEFKLEGDTLVAMQNIRALQRLMGLMRTVGT